MDDQKVSVEMPAEHVKRVEAELGELREVAGEAPKEGLRRRVDGLLARVLQGVEGATKGWPGKLYRAAEAEPADYRANWEHQLWYHLGELVRIHEGRDQRAAMQGPDHWVNTPKPTAEAEMMSQLRELAKVRALIDEPPELVETKSGEVIFDDARFEKREAWEHPPGLTVERDAERGVAWKGQNPGGDWMWLREAIPGVPAGGLPGVVIEHEVRPVSTIKGGLIIGFCVQPRKVTDSGDAAPLSLASGPEMRSYYANFDAYHFSVHRGSTGYCNLRRCGSGLIMLASFPDPCPERERWYAVQIVKAGPQVELRIDGKLVCCYVDLGHVTPVLDGGHFGLRHFQGFHGWARGVRIARIG